MIEARFQFSGHQVEERTIEAAPRVGDPISGPILDCGQTWRVKAVFRSGDGATIECETVEGPEWIHGDNPI